MKKFWITPFIVGALLFNSGCSENKTSEEKKDDAVEVAEDKNEEKFDNNKNAEHDAEFVVNTANGGMREVELSKLAKEKSKNKDVKMLAEHMIEDHTKANMELKAYAAKKNISVPDSVDEDSKKKWADLKAMTGMDFDKEYVSAMVDDHKKTISNFEDVSGDSNTDPELKTWVDNTLPKLKMHYEMSQKTDSLCKVMDKKMDKKR